MSSLGGQAARVGGSRAGWGRWCWAAPAELGAGRRRIGVSRVSDQGTCHAMGLNGQNLVAKTWVTKILAFIWLATKIC